MYIDVNTFYYEILKSFGHRSPFIQLFKENCVNLREVQNTEL